MAPLCAGLISRFRLLLPDTRGHGKTVNKIVWGDRDQFLPVEDAVELYHLLPNAGLSIISYADHFVTRTHPAEVEASIKAFLERGL